MVESKDGSDKESAYNTGDPGSTPGSGRFPEEGNGYAHSSVLTWRTLWTEEPGRLYIPWGHKESDTTE